MSSANVKLVLQGLKPKNTSVQKLHKEAIDSYVPKASGVGIVERITSTYPHESVRKNIL